MRISQIEMLVAGAMVLAVSSCGAADHPAQQAATSTAPALADEQQIQEVVTRMRRALEDYDLDAADQLTCTKLRAAMRADNESLIPPMSTFGTPEQVADPAYVASLRAGFPEQFPTVSVPTIDALMAAITKQDQDAYRTAASALVRESLTVEKFTVTNIKISGDTATADITATIKRNNKPDGMQTQTKPNTFIRENGQWKDCEPPGSKPA